MATQRDTFTMADIQEAERVLRENNVPPAACPRCGATYYVLAPPGWEPGKPIRMKCNSEERGCGHEWVMGTEPMGVLGRIHPDSPFARRGF